MQHNCIHHVTNCETNTTTLIVLQQLHQLFFGNFVSLQPHKLSRDMFILRLNQITNTGQWHLKSSSSRKKYKQTQADRHTNTNRLMHIRPTKNKTIQCMVMVTTHNTTDRKQTSPTIRQQCVSNTHPQLLMHNNHQHANHTRLQVLFSNCTQ